MLEELLFDQHTYHKDLLNYYQMPNMLY